MPEPGEKDSGALRTFASGRWRTLARAIRQAPSEELVRGFVALVLVVVLLLVVLEPPGGEKDDLVASTKTLAIAVIAFYFGLHKATHRERGPEERERLRRSDA